MFGVYMKGTNPGDVFSFRGDLGFGIQLFVFHSRFAQHKRGSEPRDVHVS